ncbi:MAG: AAA family ATPase [Deltaproteobacteria bacterium]|nr:AAA family ATPase [Deltaproteobacteria bacterium]
MPGLKINNIIASGFLSFENLELKNLNDSVNFIVGPNGSGKTNFAKLMRFIKVTILNPYNFPYAIDIKNYLKKDSHQIKIEADIDLSLDDEEIQMVSSAIAMIFTKNLNNQINIDSDYKLSLPKAISFFKYLWKEKFKNGKLVIEYDDVRKKHSILYQSINEEKIAIDIVNNFLITGYHKSTYDIHQNIFDFGSKDEETKKEFIDNINNMGGSLNNNNLENNNNFNDWLDKDLKYLTLEHFNQFGLDNKKEGESIEILFDVIKYAERFFVKDEQLGLPHGSNRVSISTIFMWIFENSIAILDNFRCPSKDIITIKEINETQNFNSNNLYSYLMQLKINKFNDYNKAKETFKKLSNDKDFDIRIKKISDTSNKMDISPAPLPLTIDQAQIIQNTNSVEVSVEDHKLELELYFKDSQNSEEYPFEFSPAGYYEMLTLSAIIAGINNKLIIFDEPAQNLHPILQHKLLIEIEKYNKDNNNQFFIITHSPDLVKIDEKSIKNIFIFRQKDKATIIYKFEPGNLDKNKFYKYEELKRLFFVKGVILVEGFSEEILMNRLIRNNEFFENCVKNESDNKNSKNTVNLGDIEVVNMEGIGSLINYINIIDKLELNYVIIIDEDIFDEKNKKNALNNLGSFLKTNDPKKMKTISENRHNVFFQSPSNFEKYVEEDLKKYFEASKYENWCNSSECNENKKINYPLYLTGDENILTEIVKGNKLKLYSDAVKCLVRCLHEI